MSCLPTGQLQAMRWEGMNITGVSGCLGARVHLLVGPELLVLLTTKSLIVVAFALKQLLKVRFAVKFPVQCGITAQAEFGVAVFATEARVVENELVCHQPLHRVHSLLAGCTDLLHLSPQAEGLGALHSAAATAAFGFMRGGGLGGSGSLEHGSSEVLWRPGRRRSARRVLAGNREAAGVSRAADAPTLRALHLSPSASGRPAALDDVLPTPTLSHRLPGWCSSTTRGGLFLGKTVHTYPQLLQGLFV